VTCVDFTTIFDGQFENNGAETSVNENDIFFKIRKRRR